MRKFALIVAAVVTCLSQQVWSKPALTQQGLQGRNFILVHGGGPHFVVNMHKLKKMLVRYGAEPDRVHLVWYDYRSDVDAMAIELHPQLQGIINIAGKGARFDVITHSLGTFIGVYSLIAGGFGNRVEKYIGLAGVAWGQNRRPGSCERFGYCLPYMETLAPYGNDFITDFFTSNWPVISQWDHCALYSADDRLVFSPRDAGEILPGTGHLVRGLGHLDFIRKERAINLLLDLCYSHR